LTGQSADTWGERPFAAAVPVEIAGDPVAALRGQNGIPGQYLSAWSRDFFTIVAR
jgi:hypothetical protein